jgi:hypothetical protein
MVHSQDYNGSPSGRGSAYRISPSPTKVSAPAVAPWVEQPDHLSCHRVDAAQIAALVQVAVMASQGQVPSRIGAAVLFGDDVFDLETEVGLILLVKPTILAAALCTLPDQVA